MIQWGAGGGLLKVLATHLTKANGKIHILTFASNTASSLSYRALP